MQRFLRVGTARAQVVGGMMHDARDTQRALASLEALHPESIIVDRSVGEWTHLSAVDTYQKVVLETIPGLHANVLWKGVERIAPQINAEIVLLHKELPGFPADAVRQLRALLKKEGFDATGDPRRDLENLHRHYVARVPGIWKALEARRDRSAARLRATLETRPRRAIIVMPFPDADVVCDRVQALGKE